MPRRCAPCAKEDIGARVRARIGGGLSRCVVVHDGEQVPTRTLVVFDGDVWRANGVGWLTRRYPGLRVVTIGAVMWRPGAES